MKTVQPLVSGGSPSGHSSPPPVPRPPSPRGPPTPTRRKGAVPKVASLLPARPLLLSAHPQLAKCFNPVEKNQTRECCPGTVTQSSNQFIKRFLHQYTIRYSRRDNTVQYRTVPYRASVHPTVLYSTVIRAYRVLVHKCTVQMYSNIYHTVIYVNICTCNLNSNILIPYIRVRVQYCYPYIPTVVVLTLVVSTYYCNIQYYIYYTHAELHRHTYVTE